MIGCIGCMTLYCFVHTLTSSAMPPSSARHGGMRGRGASHTAAGHEPCDLPSLESALRLMLGTGVEIGVGLHNVRSCVQNELGLYPGSVFLADNQGFEVSHRWFGIEQCRCAAQPCAHESATWMVNVGGLLDFQGIHPKVTNNTTRRYY